MNKKRLPIFALILASAGAMLFALIVLWLLDVDSPTVTAKVISTLQLGIPSGLALIALIWFGAGLDYALSRIQKKNYRILASVLVYLFIPGVCCIGIPALLILLFSSGMETQNDTGFAIGFFSMLAFIPAVTGFLFIYLGAGTSSISRWLAGRIGQKPEITE